MQASLNARRCTSQRGWLSQDAIKDYVQTAFEKGEYHFDWMHTMPATGEPVPVEITLACMSYAGNDVVVSYMHDIREYQHMIEEIEHRGHLLQTVNTAAGILLQTDTTYFELSLYRALAMMAQAANVKRVFVWEHVQQADQFYFNQIYEFADEDTDDFRRQDMRIYYEDEGSKRIEGRLLRGLTVSGNTGSLPRQQ